MKECFSDEKDRPNFLQIFDKINDFIHEPEYKSDNLPSEELFRKQLQELHGDGSGAYFDVDIPEEES